MYCKNFKSIIKTKPCVNKLFINSNTIFLNFVLIFELWCVVA